MKTVINIKAYKNTTNRHRMEAVRLLNLVKRSVITKQQAVDMYSDYLEAAFGRQIIREFPYNKNKAS